MKSLEELKENVQNEISQDDLVSAVIYQSKNTKIPKTRAFFQQAFFDLQKRFPDIFQEFIFDESGITPFSDELDSVLFRLESATVLATLNPTYKSYTVANSLESLEYSYNKFDDSLKTKIDECAAMFSNLISA